MVASIFPQPKPKTFAFTRDMTGVEVREHLRKYLTHSWYQERRRMVQINELMHELFEPTAPQGLRFESKHGTSDLINLAEKYRYIVVPEDMIKLFTALPDTWPCDP
jgi:hypothetical protein